MHQSRVESFVEVMANVAIGFAIAFVFQVWLFPRYGIEIPHRQHVEITAWFTLVAIIRNYVLRRLFNRGITYAAKVLYRRAVGVLSGER